MSEQAKTTNGNTTMNATINEIMAPALDALETARLRLMKRVNDIDLAIRALSGDGDTPAASAAQRRPRKPIAAAAIDPPMPKSGETPPDTPVSTVAGVKVDDAGTGSGAWARKAALARTGRLTVTDLVNASKRDRITIDRSYIAVVLRDLAKSGDLRVVTMGRGRRETVYEPTFARLPHSPAETRPRGNGDARPINPNRIGGAADDDDGSEGSVAVDGNGGFLAAAAAGGNGQPH